MVTLKTAKMPMLLARQLVPRATRLALEVACLGPAGPLVTRLASGTLVRSFRFGNFIRCLITQENPGQLLISSVVGEAKYMYMGFGLGKKFFLAMCVLYFTNARRRRKLRVQRAAAVQAFRNLNREDVQRLLEIINRSWVKEAILPAVLKEDQDWVQLEESGLRFVPEERVRWLNQIVKVLWPHLNSIGGDAIVEIVSPLIREAIADVRGLDAITIPVFNLGPVPPEIKHFRVTPEMNPTTMDEDLVIDIGFKWKAEPDIVLGVLGALTAKQTLKVQVSDLQINGSLRVVLRSLMPTLPVMGGVTITMIEEPYINYQVHIKYGAGAQVDLDNFPGLKPVVKMILKKLIADNILFPNVITECFAADAPHEPPGSFRKAIKGNVVGTLHLDVLEAEGLPVGDITGKSDPYAMVGLGITVASAQLSKMQKTSVVKKNLSPTWNAHFELDVHSTEIQNLVIRVFDEDLTSADDELSVLQLSLQSLPANKRVEDWYKLTFPAGKHLSTGPGRIKLRMRYEPMNYNMKNKGKTALRSSKISNEFSGYVGWKGLLRRVDRMDLSGKPIPEQFRSKLCKEMKLEDTKGSLHDYIKIYPSRRNRQALRKFSDEELYGFTQVVPDTYGIQGGLPPWTFFPDIDKARWIDSILVVMWPYFREVVTGWLVPCVNTEVLPDPEFGLPSAVRRFLDLETFLDIGELAPLIDGIRAYPSENNTEIMLELSLKVFGDMFMGAKAKFFNNPFNQIRVLVSQIQVATVVRIRLRPLIPKLPIVAGVSISMLQRPEIDFSTALKLSPLLPAIDLCNLPLFDFLINTAIDKVVCPVMHYPSSVNIPILDMKHPAISRFLHNKDKTTTTRILMITVHRAHNIPIGDDKTSDPFVAAVVSGAESFKYRQTRTLTQHRTLEPVWEERVDLTCESANPELVIAIVDSDQLAGKERAISTKLVKQTSHQKRETSKSVTKRMAASSTAFAAIMEKSRATFDSINVRLDFLILSKVMRAIAAVLQQQQKLFDFMWQSIKREAMLGNNRIILPAAESLTGSTIDEETVKAVNPRRRSSTEALFGGTPKDRKKRNSSGDTTNMEDAEHQGSSAQSAVSDLKQKSELRTVSGAPGYKLPPKGSMCDAERLAYDYMSIGDDVLGMCLITEKDLPQGSEAVRMKVELETDPKFKKANPGAPTLMELTLQWMMLSTDLNRNSAAMPLETTTRGFTTESPTSKQSLEKGSLSVTIYGLQEIGAKNKNMRPYVEVEVAGNIQTTEIGRGRNVQMHQQMFFHHVDSQAVVNVIVRNHKRDWMFLRGSSVGEVHIPAHQILQQGTIDQEYGLLGVKSGSISMKLSWHFHMEASDNTASTAARTLRLDQSLMPIAM